MYKRKSFIVCCILLLCFILCSGFCHESKVYAVSASKTAKAQTSLKEHLLGKIIKEDRKYSDYDADIVADDFDGDGKNEYFYVFTQKVSSKDESTNADIWFGNSKGVTRKVKWQDILSDTYGSVTLGGKKYFRYDLSYTTSSQTKLLKVAHNKCSLYFNAPGSMNLSKRNKYFTITHDCYDMLYMKSDDITCGHTWKNYYFYADDKGIHEYGAIKISKKQFMKYKNADKILKEISSQYSKTLGTNSKNAYTITCHFLKRSNGLIHINIECESKDQIEYSYRTYQIGKNSTLKLIDSENGTYVTALCKDLAVY